MVHSEHNKSKNSGGFALIILGALLLIIGPQEAIVPKSLGVFAWIAGMVIGGNWVLSKISQRQGQKRMKKDSSFGKNR